MHYLSNFKNFNVNKNIFYNTVSMANISHLWMAYYINF